MVPRNASAGRYAFGGGGFVFWVSASFAMFKLLKSTVCLGREGFKANRKDCCSQGAVLST